MDTSTIGRSAEEFFERCDHCDIEFGSYPDSDRMIYSSCEDVVCNLCMERSPNTCPICLTSDQDGHEMYAENLINEMESLGCTILTVEDQDEIELERIEYEDNMVVLGRQLHAALEQFGMEKNRHKMELEDEKNQARIELEKVKMEKNRLEMELTAERNKAKIEHEKVKELSRAHSITENFLNVADDTEKSLEKVVAGLGAIRTGCKVFVKNSGKGDISKVSGREVLSDYSKKIYEK